MGVGQEDRWKRSGHETASGTETQKDGARFWRKAARDCSTLVRVQGDHLVAGQNPAQNKQTKKPPHSRKYDFSSADLKSQISAQIVLLSETLLSRHLTPLCMTQSWPTQSIILESIQLKQKWQVQEAVPVRRRGARVALSEGEGDPSYRLWLCPFVLSRADRITSTMTGALSLLAPKSRPAVSTGRHSGLGLGWAHSLAQRTGICKSAPSMEF